MRSKRDRVGRRLYDIDGWLIDHYGHRFKIAEHLSNGVDLLQRLACLVLGHRPEEDHCGKPEHDYCLWCEKRTPGQAPRP